MRVCVLVKRRGRLKGTLEKNLKLAIVDIGLVPDDSKRRKEKEKGTTTRRMENDISFPFS